MSRSNRGPFRRLRHYSWTWCTSDRRRCSSGSYAFWADDRQEHAPKQERTKAARPRRTQAYHSVEQRQAVRKTPERRDGRVQGKTHHHSRSYADCACRALAASTPSMVRRRWLEASRRRARGGRHDNGQAQEDTRRRRVVEVQLVDQLPYGVSATRRWAGTYHQYEIWPGCRTLGHMMAPWNKARALRILVVRKQRTRAGVG